MLFAPCSRAKRTASQKSPVGLNAHDGVADGHPGLFRNHSMFGNQVLTMHNHVGHDSLHEVVIITPSALGPHGELLRRAIPETQLPPTAAPQALIGNFQFEAPA